MFQHERDLLDRTQYLPSERVRWLDDTYTLCLARVSPARPHAQDKIRLLFTCNPSTCCVADFPFGSALLD